MNKVSVKYFGVKSAIKGDFVLSKPIKSHNNGYEISIFIEDGIHKISILKKVSNDGALELKHEIRDGEPTVVVPDESDYRDYIKQLQLIESIGGYYYNINKIYYKECLELMWFSGEDGFLNLNIIYSLKKQYKPREKKLLSQENLNSILLLNRIIPDANIPYNYYREANNYLKNREYRLAYLHFYMIIEYCFANGKFEQKAQVSEYMQSIDLCFAVLDSLSIIKDVFPLDYDWLETEIKSKYAAFTLKNVFKYIYQQRGVLAHGSIRSAKYVYNDDDLHKVSNFIHQICISICGNMQVYCMSFKESKNKRLSERYEAVQKKLGICIE